MTSDDKQLYCPLCEREVLELSDHHLVPKSRGGRTTEAICLDCHRMIHVLYDNRTLAGQLGTVEELQAEPRFAKYLDWISRRPGDRRYKAKRPRSEQRRRRR